MSPELERQVNGLEAKARKQKSAQHMLIAELRKLGAEEAASTLEALIGKDQAVQDDALSEVAFLRTNIP